VAGWDGGIALKFDLRKTGSIGWLMGCFGSILCSELFVERDQEPRSKM
jgi:hypothetical protein